MKDLISDRKSMRCPIMGKSDSLIRARKFLEESGQFRLGNLPTESRHPKSMRLSQLAQTDLSEAIRIFNEIDREAVSSLELVRTELQVLKDEILDTLESGSRIFLCGCGATGRLSISLETLWREEVARQGRLDLEEKVVSFIAGGDFALVRSIENFEDHPEFGARQLLDLGFGKGDLLISSTEGGETPFVIGATEEAARIGGRKPYFIYCNPTDLLKKTTLRSKQVLENSFVNSIELKTGPMALSGSTRLQATTAQQLAVGACLFAALEKSTPDLWIQEFQQILKMTNFSQLAPLIEKEAQVYSSGHICVHETDRFGITVLTDTTERTPTFSLLPFESNFEPSREPSWTFLSILKAGTSDQAWASVLKRSPRSLSWDEYKMLYGIERTLAYDFSEKSLIRRQAVRGLDQVHVFKILERPSAILFEIDGRQASFAMPRSLLAQHLLVKCALNITSTLLMARLHRILGNVMIYVRPTNKKLIDRSIRYVQALLSDEGISKYSYETICETLFDEFENSKEDVPVVIRTFQRLKGGIHGN